MPEYDEGESVTPGAPLERISTGEILSQVEIAKRNPRNVAKFMQDLTALATTSEEVAKSCFYTLYRKDKEGNEVVIQGPSIHFMRLAAPLYKNIRWAGRQAGEEDGFVIAEGAAHDLESNVYLAIQVRRPILTRAGRRYSADMVNTTTMAAIALALRNAMLGVIAKPLWEPAYLAALKKAVGTQKGLKQRWNKLVEDYGKMGVKVEELLAFLGKEKLAQVDLGDFEKLLGTFNAIRDGAQNLDEAFGRTKPTVQEPQSNAEAGVKPSLGGPLEAALGATASPAAATQPAGSQGNGDPKAPAGDPSPEEQADIRTREQAEAGASKPALRVPQERKELLAAIEARMKELNKTSAEREDLRRSFCGKQTLDMAPIGRLQQLFLHLGGGQAG